MFVGCFVLWQRLGLGELSWDEFFHLYTVRHTQQSTGSYFFHPHVAIVREIPGNDKWWKNSWFYIPIICVGGWPHSFGEVQFPIPGALDDVLRGNIVTAKSCDLRERVHSQLLDFDSLRGAGWLSPGHYDGIGISSASDRESAFIHLLDV